MPELRYQGEANDQELSREVYIVFPGLRGPPLSRHLTPVGGCAPRGLGLRSGGGSPLCRLLWAKAFLASFREWKGRGSGCLPSRGPGAWRWLGYGISGLGDGREGCDGIPRCGISRCAKEVDCIHPGMS